MICEDMKIFGVNTVEEVNNGVRFFRHLNKRREYVSDFKL